MKILLLSHIFPPAIDGGSKVIYKLGQYFKSQHHQILYLSSDCSSTDDFVKNKYLKSDKSTSDQIKIPVYHHLRRLLKFKSLLIPKKSYHYGLLKVFQKGPIFKLIPFIKATIQILKFKPDLIIAGPLPTTIVLYANFLKKIINSKDFLPSLRENAGLSGRRFCKLLINASFHPTDPDFHQIPLINALKKADYLWTLTQSETNYFTKNFKIDPQKIILAGNGIDSDFLISPFHQREMSEGQRDFNILFIGSIAAHKRVDLLIKSFSDLISSLHQGRMPRNSEEVGLTIAGQKTLFYPQIEKLFKSLNPKIKSKINFIFNFSQKDLSKIIDNCNVLVLPSIQESFGLVVIEAWARQKPVICADIPALKELVKKSNGGLSFKIDNQNDLTKKIQFILKNPQKAQQMGQNGYKYVKNNYTWDKVGDKICQKILL